MNSDEITGTPCASPVICGPRCLVTSEGNQRDVETSDGDRQARGAERREEKEPVKGCGLPKPAPAASLLPFSLRGRDAQSRGFLSPGGVYLASPVAGSTSAFPLS